MHNGLIKIETYNEAPESKSLEKHLFCWTIPKDEERKVDIRGIFFLLELGVTIAYGKMP